MPTYEYKCAACSHQFEQFQSMKDAALRKCPSCGKLKLERLIGTGAAVLFKGSGFYQTDYRSESYKKAAEADKPATSSGGNSGSSGKDAAAATSPSAATQGGSSPASASAAPAGPSGKTESKATGGKEPKKRSGKG